MYNFRQLKRLIIWIVLFLQIFAIAVYYYLQDDLSSNKSNTSNKVLFFDKLNISEVIKLTYHTINSKIILPDLSTRDSFIDFNSSLCFINGTDIKSMQRNKNNWKCNCLPQWHGNDCSQPEVVWRAFLAYRKPVPIEGPRKNQRRLICLFEVNQFLEDITEIRVNELKDIVDLFILYEDPASNFLEKKLNGLFLKKFHKKILYMKIRKIDKSTWVGLKNVIINLHEDDVFLMSSINEIPHKLSLVYFKFYNKWPEPLSFRLKWSVYGFFWLHPSKTVVSGFAATAGYLNQNLDEDLFSDSASSFILGDLNHFGGWYCEYCYDATSIINFLGTKSTNTPVQWDSLSKRTIDSSYVEDLIENGVYLDGKTILKRAYRYRDNYYAPQFADDNSWKYDYLLYNMYSKIDY